MLWKQSSLRRLPQKHIQELSDCTIVSPCCRGSSADVVGKLTQKGRYREALERINQIDPEKLRSLKANQQWIFFCGLLQLRRQIFRQVNIVLADLTPY